MKYYCWIVFWVLLVSNAVASECTYDVPDISQMIQMPNSGKVSTAFGLKEPGSRETIRRYVQQLSDGVIGIVEQRHCLMQNLTVFIILPDDVPLETAPARLAGITEKTPEWQKWFKGVNLKKALEDEFASKRFKARLKEGRPCQFGINERVSASGESSEVGLALVDLKENMFFYKYIISLYIGIGGL